MKDKLQMRIRIAPLRAALAFSVLCAFAVSASFIDCAQAKFKTVYAFQGGDDGAHPQAALLVVNRDYNEYIYGTTIGGGASSVGTVFTITYRGESVLHAFTGGNDGAYPAANVIGDKDGNLYGTTTEGGSSDCSGTGCGTVFHIAPDGTESVLHGFQGGSTDGEYPFGGLIEHGGNLFGATNYGPGTGCYTNQGCGTVFEVSPTGVETILYAFAGGPDGGNPSGALIRDDSGNLLGPADFGGSGKYRDGVLFAIDPSGSETVLHRFKPTSNSPQGLTADADGNLYTTVQDGRHGKGAVFKIAPDGKGSFLYSFRGRSDGAFPLSAVILDAAGNVFGTTIWGGGKGCDRNGCGTIFKIDPSGAESVLYAFTGGDDGSTPNGLAMDKKGNLYGTTYEGGANGLGTVFKFTL